ncbi:MAG: sialidase family protein, partial [Anaerolineales bacterium]
ATKQAAMADNFRLFVTGADVVGNKDVWATFRDTSDIDTWYPPPQAWQAPDVITDSTGHLQDPVLISDSTGLFHLFWSQSVDPEKPDNEWRIFYSQFDGSEWLEPVGILKSPDKFANEISAAVDGNRKIYVTWHGKESGEIYFAWAEADKAYSVFEWSDPQSLPHPLGKAANPSIYPGLNNTLYVTFAIPINEGRGLYLIKSTDQGTTWSDPQLIFDGASAGWDIVGEAHLAQTDDGNLHILFAQKSPDSSQIADGLFYSNSIDDGASWATPTLVIDQPVVAFQILASDQLTLHRYWQTDVSVDSSLWHEVSLDAGLTWITSAPISVLGTPGPSDLVLDSLNRLHLLQRFTDIQGNELLQHWEWMGNSWESLDNQVENPQISTLASALTAYANSEGRLDVVTLEQQVDPNTGVLTNYLVTSNRFLDEQVPQVTPVAPELKPTETPTLDQPIVPVGTGQGTISTETTPIPATPTPISFEGMDVISPPTSSIVFLIVGAVSALVVMLLLILFMRLRGR